MVVFACCPLAQNVVYQFPDVWVCLYDQYGCDTEDLEPECVSSAWNTEGGPPDSIFYPKERTNKSSADGADQLTINASVLSEDPLFLETDLTPVSVSPDRVVHARGLVIVGDVVSVNAWCLRPSRGADSRLVSL